MVENEAHFGLSHFCGGCHLSGALHRGCITDQKGFKVLDPKSVAKFQTQPKLDSVLKSSISNPFVSILNGLANLAKMVIR
jgi:hypothetical protein